MGIVDNIENTLVIDHICETDTDTFTQRMFFFVKQDTQYSHIFLNITPKTDVQCTVSFF